MLNIAPVAIGAYLILVALLSGSFINLAADRLPRHESIVRPRSHCRTCGRQLNLVDLIPILGYALRGGRCATCRTPIGVASPVVEAACGLLMAVSLLWFGLWPGGAIGLALVAAWGMLVVLNAYRRMPATPRS